MPCCCAGYPLSRPRSVVAAIAALVLLVAACGTGSDSASDDVRAAADDGAVLYASYCSSCHGENLEGHPNWQTPNADGSYNPPPQDASGHTWHHGDPTLLQLISEGSPFPQSRMPAFGDVLTNEQILAILEFFKSNWGERERTFQREATERDLAANS